MIVNIKVSIKKTANIFFRIKAKYFTKKIKNIYQTPIIINNYNRLEYLQKQILWLETVGMTNIYIIDNLSTYPPLLDFYKTTKYTVFKLDKNVGHEALWRTHLQMRFCKDFYIYTDPDVIAVEECPQNFIEYFYKILEKYPNFEKVGFSLKIDDIPDFYIHKQKVIDWEKQFWVNEIEKNIFKSKIDTTFALYRPHAKYQCWETTLRTGLPYTLEHLPWYLDMNNLPEEEKYYIKSASNASSWYENKLRY